MGKLSALEKFRIILPNIDNEVPVTKITSAKSIPISTVRLWINLFKQKGLAGLERTKRNDSGIPKYDGYLAQIIQALTLQKPSPTIASIHRKINLIAQKKALKPLSYSTVYEIAKSINPALVTLAIEGSKVYQQQYELIYRRECTMPNEIWQADHTELDIYILDSKGYQRKPWLTTIIDDYSRAITGYFLSLDAPSSINTALALRQAIWRKKNPLWQVCGIPQILYTDHGTDFMSNHIEQVCIKLKIRRLNSMVGRPQGRGKVERFFETLNQEVLLDLPGYSLKGKPMSKPTLNLETLNNHLESFILSHYLVREHSTTGFSPLARWGENGFLPQLPESIDILDLLLLSIEKPRKIQRDGIRFQAFRYISPTLAGFVGESVTIKYDPLDLAEIRVYYQDSFLCKAVCQDIAELVVSLKEIQKARKKVKMGLYQDIKKSKMLLKEHYAENGLKTKHKQKEPIVKPTLKRYEND